MIFGFHGNSLDWDKPRLLIETDSDGKLVVNKETAECLEKISEPVVVVSVVGLYRTGKSFILNRLSGLGQGLFIKLFNSSTVLIQDLNAIFRS